MIDAPTSFTEKVRTTRLTVAVVGQDCVCLAVAHSAFDLAHLVKESRLLADATGASRRVPDRTGTVIRL